MDAYLTRAEYEAQAGVPIAMIPDGRVDAEIATASELINATGSVDTFSFVHVGGPKDSDGNPPFGNPEEGHLWDPSTERFFTRSRPIRDLLSFTLVDARSGGKNVSVSIDPADILLDQDLGSGQATSYRLRYQPNYAMWRYNQPEMRLEYTAGYDAGYVLDGSGHPTTTPSAPDGKVLPYPAWLKTATRITVDYRLGRWISNNLQGLAGLKSATTGPFRYEKESVPTNDFGVPMDAVKIIQKHSRRVYGASMWEPLPYDTVWSRSW